MVRVALASAVTALLVSGLASAQVTNPHEGDPGAIRAGRALYGARCAECHGADAKGISGPDLTELWAAGRTDELVFRTIRLGVSGSIMPPSAAPENELWAIVAYLKSIGTVSPVEYAVGDAGHGEEIFRSTCAQCHRVNGRGGRLGPDLSRIGQTRSRAVLASAIREPSASIATGYQAVTLITHDGQQIRGARKGEDAFSVQIVDTRERLQGYLKTDLREVIHDESSLMPDYGSDRLSDRDLDDLLQFLGRLRPADSTRP